MHTPQEDPAMRDWLDHAVTPWFLALADGRDLHQPWIMVTWARGEDGPFVAVPTYHAPNTPDAEPTPSVGASAHARLRVAQHHDAVVDGFAQLLTRLFPHLNPNINIGRLKISWEGEHPRLFLMLNAFGKGYSNCVLARDGYMPSSIADIVREIEYPGQYAIPF